MPERWVRKFRVKHDRAWAWHIGLFFCVEPKPEPQDFEVLGTGKRDIYLFLCLGRHDFSIGLLTEPEEV